MFRMLANMQSVSDIDYSFGGFSMNAQYSYTSSCYSDANDTQFDPSGLVGTIPAYSVIDISAAYKTSKCEFRIGVNNITNAMYFTMRTDEYPGPGIIPFVGRMFYIGLSANNVMFAAQPQATSAFLTRKANPRITFQIDLSHCAKTLHTLNEIHYISVKVNRGHYGKSN